MTIPKPLKDALAAGAVIPFVGAGVSMAVKQKRDPDISLFPSWRGFVEILAGELEDQGKPDEAEYVRASVRIQQPKYLEAMQHAKQQLGNGGWYRAIDASFDRPKENAYQESLELAELIWQLGKNLIITTNIDRVFNWTCPQSADLRVLDVQNVEFGQLPKERVPTRPTIWHLHGSVDNKDNIVFTRDQYRDFYEEKGNEAKLQTLIGMLSSKTFLFVGFSLDDAYVRQQLDYIQRIYRGGADAFYILLRESERAGFNLPNYVTPIFFSDFGEPLKALVRELAAFEPISTPQPKKPPKTHFNVPFASKGEAFVGREGLPEKLWEMLNKRGKAAIGQAVAIEGFGGLGKTQLAVEYAHGYRDRYENGVFWITADENIDHQLLKIGEDLTWISEFDKGFDHSELVRNRFRQLSNCLIIFDNVDSLNPVDDYLPHSRGGTHVLATSREELHEYYSIDLTLLSLDEARKLLIETAERTSDSEAEREALEDILTELDGLPLAIELVGGYLRRRVTISFSEYKQFLTDEPLERLEERFPGKAFTAHDKSIIRTLRISERLLSETSCLEEILDILSWSGKAAMGYSLLKELIGTNDDLRLKEALGVAVGLHFVKREEGAERYAIHRLLARVRQFEKPLNKRKKWHEKIVGRVEGWFRKKDEDGKTLSEAEIEYDHLETWQRQTAELLPAKAVWLTLLKANPLIVRGNYPLAQTYIEDARNLYRKEGLENALLLAHIYYELSHPYFYLGKYLQGKEFIEKARDLTENVKLKDRKLSADILNDLGYVHDALGEYKKALEFAEQALVMRRELFGEKHPAVTNSLNNLGLAYGALGEYKKALEFQQRSLKMQQELFGVKHPDVATTLNNVGWTYGALGDRKKALDFQEQSLEMRRDLFGNKHPAVATALNNVGSTYGELGEHRRALEFQEQALEMQQELFGAKHPAVAVSLGNVGSTYGELGEYKKALGFQEQALKMQQELFGAEHPAVATALNHVGSTYGALGEYKKALEFQEQALEMRRELFGDKHPDVATALNSLGLTYGALGDRKKALEFLEQALRMLRELFGDLHPDTLTIAENTITECVRTGNPEKAGRLAAEFLPFIPPNHRSRAFFEKHGAPYRKVRKLQGKKRRR